MSFHSVVPVMNLQVKLLSKFGIQLIHFNPKRKEFTLTYSTFRNRIKIWIVLISVAVLFFNGCYAIFFREDVPKMFVEVFTIATAPALLVTWKVLLYPDPFVSCVNMMLHFEKNEFRQLGKWFIDIIRYDLSC